ncbi:MAG: VOC family protein [Armatimonadota bacterium]|nr:VOC family protein [Armatimonadota bacterium]
MGGFVHIEIPTGDLRRAKAFYGKVFGWTFRDYGKEYVLFEVPGGGVGGGLTKVKKVPTKAAVNAYIEVDDIDATLKEIKKARGKVLRGKTDIGGGMGSWASFADNQGAVLFLWQRGAPAAQTSLPM